MLSVHSVLEKSVFRVEVVENGVGIGLVRRSKNNDLHFLVGVLKAFN